MGLFDPEIATYVQFWVGCNFVALDRIIMEILIGSDPNYPQVPVNVGTGNRG